ncbi:Tfp pilus assembly protein FimV-like protein [Psychromonas ingrahamii 37]|uniref:Tfp pilus assembly protein FimV-like protein n=1 Tax=Psychromonas ingrahamii (strain DSM 17664 / CCUG 51855 / 37) TaxID=357804 RepID=A1SW91_PSYIN|nr:FimV/HubP family polar landmark protein [Psychromonas ingrahamii]ABM03756.1 Tfp pilus assembly protein FimV-like protein [Psychromonas ingrahamii 37]
MKRLLLIFTCCSPLVLFPAISFALDSTISTAQEMPSYKKYGPIRYNESLWSVSTKLRPNSSVSIQQTLLAIYKLNPDAFVAADINNFIEDAMINVPTYTFIKKQSHQDAINLINNFSGKSKTATKSVAIAKSKKVIIIKSPSLSKQATVTIVDTGDQSLTASLIDKKHLPDPNSSVSPASEYGNDQQNNLKTDNIKNTLLEQPKDQLFEKIKALEDELTIVNEQLADATKTNEEFKTRLQQLIDKIDILKPKIEDESAAQLTLLKLLNQSKPEPNSAQQSVINRTGVNDQKGSWIKIVLSNLLLITGGVLLLIALIFSLVLRR